MEIVETTKPIEPKKYRCFMCNKKIPLAMRDSPCKCGHEFCTKHRLPESHECGFDIRSEHLKKSASQIDSMRCVRDKVIKL